MTNHYRDSAGKYIGGFDGAEPPEGAIEVPIAPCDARDVWNGTAWTPAAPVFADQKAVEVAAYIETREKMCARVAGIGQRLGTAGDTASGTSCDAVVNALLDVLAHPSVTGATDINALKLALKTRYVAAVSLASTAARAEFKRYDK